MSLREKHSLQLRPQQFARSQNLSLTGCISPKECVDAFKKYIEQKEAGRSQVQNLLVLPPINKAGLIRRKKKLLNTKPTCPTPLGTVRARYLSKPSERRLLNTEKADLWNW